MTRALPLLLATLTLALGCRPKEGERCICADECAGGLVCAADGAVLREGQCVSSVSNDLESGVCVDASNVNFDDDSLTPPPRFDAGSWATDGPMITTATTAGSDPTTTDPGSSSGESSSSSGDSSSSSSGSDGSSSSGSSGSGSSTSGT